MYQAYQAGTIGTLLKAGIALTLFLVAGCSDPAARKQQYLDKGNQYFGEGKYSFAIIEYKNAVATDSMFGEARKRLAEAYARSGDGREALQESIRAADLLPQDHDAQVMAGSYLLAARRPKESLARADAALALRPDSVQALLLRGNALSGLSSFDEALKAIEEAIRLDPDRGATFANLGLVEMARGNSEDAEAAFKRAVMLSPETADVHLALGNFYWATGRAAEAEKSFLAALALEPTNVAANRVMAALTFSTGRAPEAEPYLRRMAESSPGPEAMLALTDYYILTGRPKNAVTELEKLTTNHVAGASLRLARAHAAGGDVAKAMSILDGILGDSPSDASAHALKAQILFADGKRDEALAAARTAVTADAASTEAQFLLGRLYAERGDVAAADAAFNTVLRLNPRAAAAQLELGKLQLMRGKAEASVRLADEAAKNSSQSLPARLILLRGLIASKDFARADRELASLRGAFPDVASVHVQAALLGLMKNDAAAARDALERAQTLDGRSNEVLSAWIAYDFQTGNAARARSRLEGRLEEASTPDLLILAAQTYLSMKDPAAAERSLRAAIEKDPSQLRAYALLGQLYLSQKKLDQARMEFEALASRQAKPVGALTMSGMILQAQGNLALAKRRFEDVLVVDSHAVIAANNLAWLHAESGENLDTALQLAQTATAASPDVPELMDTLGWVYYKKDLPKLAVPLFARCVELAPSNPTYHYHLGLSHIKAGDGERGRDALQQALKLGPDGATASAIQRILSGRG